MKISSKIIVFVVVLLAVGLGLVCVGLVFDPFSLPFQDYEQMPLEMQQMYETRAIWMQGIRLVGGAIAILASLIIPVAWLAKQKKLKG